MNIRCSPIFNCKGNCINNDRLRKTISDYLLLPPLLILRGGGEGQVDKKLKVVSEMTIDLVTTLGSQDFDSILRPLSHQVTILGLDRLKN